GRHSRIAHGHFDLVRPRRKNDHGGVQYAEHPSPSVKGVFMLRLLSSGLPILLCLLSAASARADHFTVDLEVQADKTAKKGQADTVAVGEKAKDRPTLDVKAGKTLTVKW